MAVRASTQTSWSFCQEVRGFRPVYLGNEEYKYRDLAEARRVRAAIEPHFRYLSVVVEGGELC
jgi:hypothetical protein